MPQNVSFGMPGLAYANFERTGPVVQRFNSGAVMSEYGDYGITLRLPAILGGVAARGAFGGKGLATANNINRLRRRLARKQKALKKAKRKWRKKALRKEIKLLKRKIANLVKKKKRQIARRKAKGKKLNRRQRRFVETSRALQKQRKRRFKGQTRGVPRWFMPNAKRKDRARIWAGMSAKQRRAAFKRFRQSRVAGRMAQGVPDLQMAQMMPLPGASTFDQQFSEGGAGISSMEGGYPDAMPDFSEGRAAELDDMEEAGEQFDDDMEGIEEESAGNKLFLYGGIALAGIVGVYFLTKKKGAGKGNGKRTRKSGRAR